MMHQATAYGTEHSVKQQLRMHMGHIYKMMRQAMLVKLLNVRETIITIYYIQLKILFTIISNVTLFNFFTFTFFFVHLVVFFV